MLNAAMLVGIGQERPCTEQMIDVVVVAVVSKVEIIRQTIFVQPSASFS
jgi:hypothetical protein